jgi:hypothetical protein
MLLIGGDCEEAQQKKRRTGIFEDGMLGVI